MKLENLLFSASLSLALAGCETEYIIRKPKPMKPIPEVVIDKTPIKAKEGYETLRLDQGEFEIYDITVYKPKPDLKLEAQGNLIKKLASDYNFYLKDIKKELNLELLTSERTLPISKPDFDAVDCIDKSLNSQGSDKSTKALALCSINGSSASKLPNQFGYGVRIGANYIIVPASVIYPSLILKEIGGDSAMEFSMLSEHKIAGSGTVRLGKVLAINPIADLALVETNERYFTGLFMPIVEEKQIEEAKLFIDRNISSLTNVFKLNEDQLLWRLIGKENDLAKSLGYSIATIEGLSNKRGLGVYNDSGLIGLISQDIKKYLDSEEEFQNALVIPGSQIRKFLTDYLNFLKSGSNNLETILINNQIPKEITSMDVRPSTFTPSLPSTVTTSTTAPTTSEVPTSTIQREREIQRRIEQETPIEPIKPPFGKLFSIYAALVLGAGIIGRRYYLKNPQTPKEIKEEGIPARLSELEKWFKDNKEKSYRKVPKTILDIKNQETVMGLVEDLTSIPDSFITTSSPMPRETFVRWLNDLISTNLPKDYLEFKKGIHLHKWNLDKQKTRKLQIDAFIKEREDLIKKQNIERAIRMEKLLFPEII